jgi:hypothetical protein
MEEALNTLVYKRTHTGDPGKLGIFGIHDCMGRVRRLPFDAVIGVGGKRPDRGSEDIARKITWIGINPCKTEAPFCQRANILRLRGPLVAFEYFVLLDEGGPDLEKSAPKLSKHMFKDDKHFVMSRSLRSEDMKEEVQKILRWAKNLQSRKRPSKCKC